MLHLKSLKEKLSGYGADPFTLVYPINLVKRKKIGNNGYNDMGLIEILGIEKLNGLFQKRLIDGKVGFLDTAQDWN